MIKRFISLLWLLLLVVSITAQAQQKVQSLRVATWNVENLFDADDDPNNPGDDEYTPTSWRRWTEARYRQKLTNVAVVVSDMNPDILCVQEIENRRVLEDLAKLVGELKPGLNLGNIAHKDSSDFRGIDVGLLTRFPVKDFKLREDLVRLRGALVVTMDVDGTDVTVITCHWKSWLGEAEANIVTRLREALVVRSEVDALREVDPEATIIVAGDFNDNFDGHSLQQGLAAYADRDLVLADASGRLLYNVLGDVSEADRGSYYYARRKVWNTFDSLIIMPGMLQPPVEAGPAWRLSPRDSGSVTVFKPEYMCEKDGRPKPFRRVRLKDGTDSYAQGYSDHFPIMIDLIRANYNP